MFFAVSDFQVTVLINFSYISGMEYLIDEGIEGPVMDDKAAWGGGDWNALHRTEED